MVTPLSEGSGSYWFKLSSDAFRSTRWSVDRRSGL